MYKKNQHKIIALTSLLTIFVLSISVVTSYAQEAPEAATNEIRNNVFETLGPNYIIIENYNDGKGIWQSSHDRILDYVNSEGEAVYVDGILNDQQDFASIEMENYSIVFDKPTCTLQMFDGGRIQNGILGATPNKVLSHTLKSALNGTDVWDVEDINTSQCDVKITKTNEGYVITSTQNDSRNGVEFIPSPVNGTDIPQDTLEELGGIFEIRYDVGYDWMEWTYDYLNQDDNKNNHKFGFTFQCDGIGCNDVLIDDVPLDIGIEKTIGELNGKGLRVGGNPFDLKDEEHGRTWSINKPETNKLVADFTNAPGPTGKGERLIVDPTFTDSDGTDDFDLDDTGNNALCDGDTIAIRTGNNQIYGGPRQATDSSDCYYAFIEWDITSIPNGSVATSGTITVEIVSAYANTETGEIIGLPTKASTESDANNWSNCDAGTVTLASGLTEVQTTGTNKVLTLDVAPLNTYLSSRLVDDHFSVCAKGSDGTQSANEEHFGIGSEENASTPDPTLTIEYIIITDAPNPPVDLSGIKNTETTADIYFGPSDYDGVTQGQATQIIDYDVYRMNVTDGYPYFGQQLPDSSGQDFNFTESMPGALDLAGTEWLSHYQKLNSPSSVTYSDDFTTDNWTDNDSTYIRVNGGVLDGDIVMDGTNDRSVHDLSVDGELGAGNYVDTDKFIWEFELNHSAQSVPSGIRWWTVLADTDQTVAAQTVGQDSIGLVWEDNASGDWIGLLVEDNNKLDDSSGDCDSDSVTLSVPTVYYVRIYQTEANSVHAKVFTGGFDDVLFADLTCGSSTATINDDMQYLSFVNQNIGPYSDTATVKIDNMVFHDGVSTTDPLPTTVTDSSIFSNDGTTGGKTAWFYEEDFAGCTSTTCDGEWSGNELGYIFVDTTNDIIDGYYTRDGSYDYFSTDLGTPVCAGDCVLQYTMKRIVTGTSHTFPLGLHEASCTTWSGSCEGLVIAHSNHANTLIYDMDSPATSSTVITCAKYPGVGSTWYYRMTVEGGTAVALDIWNDDFDGTSECSDTGTYGGDHSSGFQFLHTNNIGVGGANIEESDFDNISICEGSSDPSCAGGVVILDSGNFYNAAQLDGNAYINFTDANNDIRGTNDFLFATWFNLTNAITHPNHQTLFSFESTNDFEIRLGADSVAVYRGTTEILNETSSHNPNSLNHLLLTKTSNVYDYSSNGTQVGLGDTDATSLGNPTNDIYHIGADGALLNLFDGVIDETITGNATLVSGISGQELDFFKRGDSDTYAWTSVGGTGNVTSDTIAVPENTDQYVKVTSDNSAFESTLFAVTEIQMNALVESPGPPVSPAATNNLINQINFTATASNATGVIGYAFFNSTDNETWFNFANTGNFTDGVIQFLFDGIDNGSTMYIKTSAFSANNGTNSTSVPGFTPDVPVAPTITLVDLIGLSNLNATWTQGADNNSTIKDYGVQLWNSTDSSGPHSIVGNSTTPSPLAELILLDVSHSYKVQVREGNSVGWSPWSANSTDTPTATEPDAPSFISINFEPPDYNATYAHGASDGQDDVDWYKWRYTNTTNPGPWYDGSTNSTTPTPLLSFLIGLSDGLEIGESYNITIADGNSVGWSPWSTNSSINYNQETDGSVSLVTTNVGDVWQINSTVSITAGDPSPVSVTQLKLYVDTILKKTIAVSESIATGGSSSDFDSIWYQDSSLTTKNYTVIAVVSSTPGPTVNLSSPTTNLAIEYLPTYEQAVVTSEGYVNYTVTGNTVKVNRDKNGATYQIECGEMGQWDAIFRRDITDWTNQTGQGFTQFNHGIVGDGFITCYNDDELFTMTVYGSFDNMLIQGLSLFTETNIFFGIPPVLFLVIMIAAFGTSRNVPTVMVMLLSVIGILGAAGLLILSANIWGLVAFAGGVAIFIKTKFF